MENKHKKKYLSQENGHMEERKCGSIENFLLFMKHK
jgi:hypothetical protein